MKNIGFILIVILAMFSCDISTSVCVKNYTLTPIKALVQFDTSCFYNSRFEDCFYCDSLTFNKFDNDESIYKKQVSLDSGKYVVEIPSKQQVFLLPIGLGNCIDKVSVISSFDTLEVIDFEKNIKEYKSKGILETKYPNRYSVNVNESSLIR
jgi:predicted small secreted protein